MSSLVLRASLLTVLGAAIGLALNASPRPITQEWPPDLGACYGCKYALSDSYLEFPPFVFPGGADPNVCMIRHNFSAHNGSCYKLPSPPGGAECSWTKECNWSYSVVCTGTGCVGSTGEPTTSSGTWSFNGVPVSVIIPCGQTLQLPNQPCGSNATITNFAYAPFTINGPVLSLQSNTLTCEHCRQ